MADPELDIAAGEFALGTLDGDERRAFLRRLARDPAAVAAVQAWQERLAPLALSIDEVAPPPGLFAGIERMIDSGAPRAANDNRAGRLWQGTAIAATLAAIVAGTLLMRTTVPGEQAARPAPLAVRTVTATSGIAALSAQGATPGLFVTYDKASGKVRVVPVGLTPSAQHDFELWMIKGAAAPKPMGVISPSRAAERIAPNAAGGDVSFAVSVEPLGGSPTGAPTGPVVYSGKLIDMPSV